MVAQNRLPLSQTLSGDVPPEQGIHTRFTQHRWVQDILPLMTSLTLHATIVVIGVLAFRMLKDVATLAPKYIDQPSVPEAAIASEIPSGIENPGLTINATRSVKQDEYEDNTSLQGFTTQTNESAIAEAAETEKEGVQSLIAIGPTPITDGSPVGSRDGKPDGKGTGPRAPFGPPGGGIPGPAGKIFPPNNARTIAFCCDSSGSMIDKFSALKQELSKAIGALKPIQQFSVVFFADGKVLAFDRGVLVSATPENKRKAERWLDDLTTSGTSDPIPGLEIAFKSHPELMYILTDGDFPNNGDVLRKIDQLNTGKKTRIITRAFVAKADDETSESFEKFLKTIADQNRGGMPDGDYKKVSLTELK